MTVRYLHRMVASQRLYYTILFFTTSFSWAAHSLSQCTDHMPTLRTLPASAWQTRSLSVQYTCDDTKNYSHSRTRWPDRCHVPPCGKCRMGRSGARLDLKGWTPWIELLDKLSHCWRGRRRAPGLELGRGNWLKINNKTLTIWVCITAPFPY